MSYANTMDALKSLVKRATHPSQEQTDWTTISFLCDTAKNDASSTKAKYITEFLRKRLRSKKPEVVRHCYTVLDTLMKNVRIVQALASNAEFEEIYLKHCEPKKKKLEWSKR
eukprot:TRINITY_DN16153_c0_g1_i1.p1 TRINITY_DN16153_c0_g1~~TRINITY_DN16153_c0_g1_i1.p1  ORF type:complete len:112 (-),score=11.53 TRINITY_DN16153_c0_g1_i1:42-377(-)